jgi:hypothetical protein
MFFMFAYLLGDLARDLTRDILAHLPGNLQHTKYHALGQIYKQKTLRKG